LNSELGMRKKKAIGLRIAARIEDRGLRSEVGVARMEVGGEKLASLEAGMLGSKSNWEAPCSPVRRCDRKKAEL